MVQALPLALAVGGSLVKGIGANSAHRANARALDAQGVAELNDGVAREARIREDARLSMGRLVAAQGESGFQMGAGSALEALAESQINATLDALQVRREAAMRDRALGEKARQERKAGTMALIGMGFDIANTIVGQQGDWAAAKAGRRAAGGMS